MESCTWLEEHLETFVRKHLGRIPNVDGTGEKSAVTGSGFFQMATKNWDKHMMTVLQAVWFRTKQLAGERKVLFPGRDVWPLEILARVEGTPTIFCPEISSCVANSKIMKDTLKDYHCIDTGYSGSVPKSLECTNWHLVWWSQAPQRPVDSMGKWKTESTKDRLARVKIGQVHMVFPDPNPNPYGKAGIGYAKTGMRVNELAGYMEGSPKYWGRGEVLYKDPSKTPLVAIGIKPTKMSAEPEFASCAIMTQRIANAVKPNKVKIFYKYDKQGA